MAVLRSTVINDTGYLSLPSGTTAQRLGETNTTLVYFTSVGATTWTVPTNIDTVEVLVVGGGGGGGNDMGGGGGGGGVVYSAAYDVTPGETINITIGQGGSGAPSGTSGPRGSNGSNSTFAGSSGTITAYGGGGGASDHDNSSYSAGSGASGGGASGGGMGPSGGANGFASGGSGGYGGGARGVSLYPDQGNDGSWGTGYWYPGGGGGAGGEGQSYPRPHGGPGVANNITGTVLYWGGGGGGSGYSSTGGDGGIGGGGGGAVNTTYGGLGYNNGGNGGGGGTNTWAQRPGGAGGANTGGGGGGGSHYNSNNYGGAGGSGIVIVKYGTNPGDDNAGAGSMRINSETGAAEYLSATGLWQSMAIPFKERTIITTAYMLGGYKSSVAWNNVNRTQTSTDVTINLGDGSIERSFNYQWGGNGRDIAYVFGAGNGHYVSSNYIIGYNMRTEQQYSSFSSRTRSWNGLNSGGIFREHYEAFITGGGSSNIDNFNFITETISQNIGGGWSSTRQWGMSWENEGIFYWANDSRWYNMITRTTQTSWSGQPSNHDQQKSQCSKLNYGWAGNEGSWNGGYNMRKTNFITRQANISTHSKPRGNCGEENFSMGQDWCYMLGNYDGAQNNGSWKWYYYTDTGPNLGNTGQPKGKGGSSSGVCAWRD